MWRPSWRPTARPSSPGRSFRSTAAGPRGLLERPKERHKVTTTPTLGLRRVTTAVGAVIDGVDLREPLVQEAVQFIRQALLDHGVVFFHDQGLSDDEMERFVTNFGRPMPEPFLRDETRDTPAVGQANLEATKHSTAVWHSDTTFVPEPPMLTALRAVRLPPFGGDTCWASMYAAYDALSERLRQMLDG